MIEIDTKKTEPVTVAYVLMTGPYSRIPEAMGRLYGWIAQHGLRPLGMPSAVYFTPPDAVAPGEPEWEVRAPLASGSPEIPVDDSDCGVKHVESALVAYTLHRGPYETIAPAYEALQSWVPVNGFRFAGPPEEVYFSDPSNTAPEDYLTEIRFPIEKA